MRSAAIAVIGISCLWASQAQSAPNIEDFNGVWIEKSNDFSLCSDPEAPWAEGPFVHIFEDYYREEAGDECDEPGLLLKNNKLHVSTTCLGSETGFAAIVTVYELSRDKVTLVRVRDGVEFLRCPEEASKK